MVVQWLGLHTANAEGTGSIPVWGTKIPHITVMQPKKIKVKYMQLEKN